MTDSQKQLRDLPGLGVRSEQMLTAAGIKSVEQLHETGPIAAYIQVHKSSGTKPSLNLLYALVSATEGTHWLSVAREQRESLLMALEGYDELQKLFEAHRTD
ncbi:MAG: TfoX/Sxy family protein [Amphritea sp.]|nr:TfoX/Sxy family protein [Amphritea sp.]